MDLSRWRVVPLLMIALGGLLALIGALVPSLRTQFAFSYLLSFMFFLSLCVGGLFLTLAHHIFDAAWSVPIRRINENLACLLPVMAGLFIPIALLAPTLYGWMRVADPHTDHALHAKLPLFTRTSWYVVAAICFAAWSFWSLKLRSLSLQQDKTGEARYSFAMRRLACGGIFVFAITVTMAVIMWMKALQHQWFSTMYGVVYFAGSVWTTLATVYVISLILVRQGPLRPVMREKQFYFLGSILFAFTVFYAYVTFSQYFIIWNANMPEETFFYVLREKGSWWEIGIILIFGHFFLPFLTLLRIDAKLFPPLMIFLGVWAWLMHWLDMSFNIMPIMHPEGFVLHWLDIACFLFIGGVLAKVFLIYYVKYPVFPQQDPRFAEGQDIYVEAKPAQNLPAHGNLK